MKTNFNLPDYGTLPSERHKKTGTPKRLPHRTRRTIYPSLTAFLNQFSIPVNQYGEPVISGRRVC